MKYKYLDQINFPNDLRKFSIKDLNFIAKDLRLKTIDPFFSQNQSESVKK